MRWWGLLWVLCVLAGPVRAAQDFEGWLDHLRDQARAEGISRQTIHQAFDGLTQREEVVKQDRNQPEQKTTFEDYVTRRSSPALIAVGLDKVRENRVLLEDVAARYGVQAKYIAAIWGIETSFGRFTGNHPVFQALASLSFDQRRRDFFTREFITALRMVDQGVPADKMVGSWAGAVGQSQFLPSSYLAYAVDDDGDGFADIWSTRRDVFASIANYLKQHGWQDGVRWGREVTLTRPLPSDFQDFRPLSYWAAQGVRTKWGHPLPEADLEAALIQPDGPGSRAFLVYRNFRVIMRYNPSVSYAATVGLLADALM